MRSIIELILSDQTTKISFLVSALFLIIFILAGGFRFVVWDQIRVQHGLSERQYIEESVATNEDEVSASCDSTLSLCFLMTMSHKPRILLTQPILFFSRALNVNSDLIFTIQVLLNFLITSLLLGFTLKKRMNGLNLTHIYWLALLGLSLFMNGRLSYAFVGISLFIAYFDGQIVRSFWSSLSVLLLAFFFVSVSSGVLFAAYITAGLMWFVQSIQLIKLNSWPIKKKFFALTLSLMVATIWVLAGVAKNLTFFKGSPLKMANHGYGKIILSLGVPVLFLFLGLVIFAALVLVPKLLKSNLSTYLFSITSVAVSLGTGVYGYSIMAGFTPAYLLLLSVLTFLLLEKRSLLPKTNFHRTQ